MITRTTAYGILLKECGINLNAKAKEFGVTIIGKSGEINKGWKGLTLEKMIGIAPNNKKAPNGLGFELKSVSYCLKNGIWSPRETMAVAMLNPDDVIRNDFFNSHLWAKIKNLIFCVVSWDGPNSIESRLVKVMTFDLLQTRNIIDKIQYDYDLIRNKLKTQGFQSLTSQDGTYIQARTKGAGHGSRTRAFYAKKCFLKEICPPFHWSSLNTELDKQSISTIKQLLRSKRNERELVQNIY